MLYKIKVKFSGTFKGVLNANLKFDREIDELEILEEVTKILVGDITHDIEVITTVR